MKILTKDELFAMENEGVVVGSYGILWRPIPDFEEYEVNPLGEVWSTKSEKFMNTFHGRGQWVKMFKDGKRFTRGVQKIVDAVFPDL